MNHGLIILVTAIFELWWALNLPLIWGLFIGNIAVVTALVGLSSLLGLPGLLGKRSTGEVPLWSYIAFWPWHALLRTILYGRRHWISEPISTEIHPGWHVGGWPHSLDMWPKWPAVVDTTCELPRHSPPVPYVNVPTWDATAPSIEDIERGVAFALAQRSAGREVLVHCAAGHGRSATVLAAALVAAGIHSDWREAVAHMKTRRPGVRLVKTQQQALDRWANQRG